MRHLIFTLGLLFSNLLYAQDTLRLTIDSPEPRIGDMVELSFSIDFLTDEFKGQLNDGIEMTNANSIFGSQSEDFTRILEFSKLGKQTVGPFRFEFNGETILTDSIILNVAEKLPYEEGLWVRVASDKDGDKFLIVEQLIKNESDYSEDNGGFSYSEGGVLKDQSDFAEIERISENGVKIIFKQSRTNTISKDDADVYAPGLSYSFKKYGIEFGSDSEDTFTLKKKHFKNLPKKTSFKKIEITR